ncbi:class I SAM-dependent methyltransferase [Mediterraneibacter glycyrrhizinilyticus]|uniref:class I SAM-dependent methyltransferase n=1 Tax=Mediterraneibacter glycyrrhizinilyticus TaxID=342942 RepID=UPI0019617E13|nr:class I SAM-dependent methyltransferase [Mediterraneibacter glycyrrhizinilyticus]MBM6751642.1 class I SAM-dependent methyltransferase [Mediterraneibacter glycyrrhizinilyticus]
MMSEYYEINAKQYAAATFSADMSEQYRRFLPLLKEGVRILDVGSGSGRDACCFQKMGYQVTALEPSKNLCREIRKVFPGEVICSDIQNYRPRERYDGIWACASFLHLQEEEVLCFFEKIDLYLNDNGIVYLSGKNGIPTGKAEDGRYFLEFTEGLVEKILVVNERVRMEELWYTGDVSGRDGFRWMNVMFRIV